MMRSGRAARAQTGGSSMVPNRRNPANHEDLQPQGLQATKLWQDWRAEAADGALPIQAAGQTTCVLSICVVLSHLGAVWGWGGGEEEWERVLA